MNLNFALLTLGCPKNEADSDHLAASLVDNGFIQTQDFTKAQILIVNSCGFIESAKEESIEAVLELAALKETGRCEILVLLGCLGQRYGQELANEIFEIDIILGTHNLLSLPDKLKRFSKDQRIIELTSADYPSAQSHIRIRPSLPYSYLKIADGCSAGCSYCIIPTIKGPYKSRPIEELLKEAKLLIKMGTKEIILVAQDTALYGVDLYKRQTLSRLLFKISDLEGDFRLRLLYLQPFNLIDDIIEAVAINKKVCKYLDLPFQHASKRVLKSMGRPGSYKDNLDIIGKARAKIDDLTIRSTFITGFPGETNADFNEMANFLAQAKLDYAGFFKYSAEEGTLAANLSARVSKRITCERYDQLVALQDEISFKRNQSYVGKQIEVLIGPDYSKGGGWGSGRHQAPEIDGEVKIICKKGELASGDLAQALVTRAAGHDLIARRVDG